MSIFNELGNLALWNYVEKTDPKHTKEFKRKGGFQGTAINSAYLVKKATKAFGPVGIGWGYDILEDKFFDGAPIMNAEGAVVSTEKVHRLKVSLWYIYDGTRGEVTHYGQTMFIESGKYGIVTDEEASKKSLTDALGKCLSMIGFSSDIYMGLYDDQAYVQDVRAELESEKQKEKREAIEEGIKSAENDMKACSSLKELTNCFAIWFKWADGRGYTYDEAGKKVPVSTTINDFYKQYRAKLEPNSEKEGKK